jgi:hypothetical protein
MARYCVNRNAQPTGEHEVHNVDTCGHLPFTENRIGLGSHVSCFTAVAAARQHFWNVDGCAYCCPQCHTR